MLTDKIKFSFDRSRGTYGTLRLKADLAEEHGLKVSRRRIRRLMSSANLRVRCKRKFRTTTQSKYSSPVAENILNRDFQASAPNQKWVTDITYLPCTDGWLYLATVMDLYSRKIVGWAMHARLETVLLKEALHMALSRRQPGAGLLHHSDRGSQDASATHRQALQRLEAVQYADEGLRQGASGTDALRLRQQRAMTLSYLGRTEDHLDAAQTLLAEARAQGDLYYSAVAHGTLAYAFEDSGDPGTAAAHYQQAITLYRRISQWPLLATLLNNYAQSLSGAGRPAEALELLDEAARLPDISPRHHGWIGLSRALVHHQYGLHAEALQSTARAVHLLHEAHLTGDVIVAQLLATERLVMDGQLGGARELLRAARGLLADQPRNMAHLQFSQGVLVFAEGDHAGAAALFADAQDGNLTEWDQARAALYRLAADLEQGNSPDATALGWLRQQSGWSGRLDAVFGGPAVVGRVPLRLELLGPLEVHHASGHLHFPLRRSAELLAYLALHGPATRQQLLAALWEGTPDAKMVDLFKKTLRGLRETLRPLVPAGMDPVVIENGKHRPHPVLDVSAAWLPDDLFPAPAVRRGGPIEVRGAFLADAQGPWADDVRAGVQERLCAELERRAAEHDPSVLNALRVSRGLT